MLPSSSGVKRSNSAIDLHSFGLSGIQERDVNANVDSGVAKSDQGIDDVIADDEGQDGLHRSKNNPSLIPIQSALNELLIEKAPDHLLVDRTPEGFRRIRGGGQKQRRDLDNSNDVNNNWGNKSGRPGLPGDQGAHEGGVGDRGSYIPFPSMQGDDTRGGSVGTTPVELQVTNLDQSVDQKEMKKLITALFREHVAVLHVSVFFQSDGNMAACVRVPSLTDAQFAISQLHRKKVGFKRILISHSHCNSQNPAVLRSKVASILKEVPGGRIQLFKFREMFEKRFHDSIGVSDLYKMKDLVTVTEDSEGRMVTLNKHYVQYAGSLVESGGMTSYAAAASRGASDPMSNGVVLDPAFCPIHCTANQDSVGWAERENGTLLPNVNISLCVLGPNMKQLVKSHGGALPLASLSVCYTAVFGKDSLPGDNEYGVALEHLVSCIRGIQIVQAASGAKRLILMPTLSSANLPHHWNPNLTNQGFYNKDDLGEAASNLLNSQQPSMFRNSPFNTPNPNLSSSLASSNSSSRSSSLTNLTAIPPQYGAFPGSGPGNGGPNTAAPLAGQLSLFTRELVDLMKSTPGCKMPFHKFIPSYHHHFGRQCRVADYGYTKLKDLFEALPHVIQIMGEGRSRAMITLSHRAQVKRFTSDLLRVLKSQASKQVSLSELPAVFEKTLNRKFKISDYGVCDVEDILQEVSETSVVLSGEGDDVYIAIPKREQTQDEMERTHHFAKECIELLRHAPDCRLPFNKFVPAYHHHFGRQCRVADYGFTKLIELFEAIPLTVEITEDADGERLLQLTDSERLKVLGAQIESLIRAGGGRKEAVPLDQMEDLYRKQFGYPLRPDDYSQTNVVAILKKLPQLLRIESDEKGENVIVKLIDRTYIKALGIQVMEILAEQPEGRMKLCDFEKAFFEKFKTHVKSEQIHTDLAGLIEIEKPSEEDAPDKGKHQQQQTGGEEDVFIKLTSLQLCAVKIQKLLEDHNDKILCSDFEAAFVDKYNTPLLPGQYGYPSLNSLIRALPENFAVRGRGARKMIWYLKDGSGGTTGSGTLQSAFGAEGSSSLGSSRSSSLYGGSQRSFGGGSSRFGSAGNLTSSGTTRFSTSRHEGFRMVTPTRNRPSHSCYASNGFSSSTGGGGSMFGPNSPWNKGLDGMSTSPLQPKFKSQPISFPNSPSSRRFNYPPPIQSNYPTQQEMDLAQFGLFPGGQNGQMIPGVPTNLAGGPSSRQSVQRRAFPAFQNMSANPFLTTPGSSFGLGGHHSSKFMSTSPISPLIGAGQSLLPVPHSPLLQNPIGNGTSFSFANNPWMSYYEDSVQSRGGGSSTPPN